VRSGKGDKDRTTIPPESAVTELEAHLADAKALFETDRPSGVAGVELPRALERKYPNAGKEWAWFRIFPACGLSSGPRSGILRRHHFHHSRIRKNLQATTIYTNVAGKNTLGVVSPLDQVGADGVRGITTSASGNSLYPPHKPLGPFRKSG
jgi:hypothetical protein